MAEVLIKYKADAGDLEAIVTKINKVNDDVVKSATDSSKRVSDEFKKIGATAVNAFANQQLSGAVKNLNTQFAGLTTGLRLNTDALKKFDNATDNTTDSLKDFDEEVKKTNKILVQSAQDVAKYEDRLRELSVAGQRNTDEFKDIAKAVGEYKSAIIAADRAVDLYAKSTDAATGRIGELEDKLYDLALAGQSNTQEFKDLVREVANVKRAIVETDKQVDSFVERSRGFGTVVQNIELVGNAFQVVEGAAALFGDENEELQKTLVKLQAITAITSGIEQARLILIDQTAQKTGIAAIAQRAYGLAVGQSTGALKIFRIALLATGVGALALGLVALISNFDKVKRALENSIPFFKDVSNAIGGVVDTIKDWVGASDDAERAGSAFEAGAKKQKASSDATVKAIERQIKIEEAAGRSTTALELQREQAVIAANKAILKDYQNKSSEIVKLDAEEKQKAVDIAFEANQQIKDAENNLKVIKIEAAQEATEKAKEEAKKRADAEKKAAEDLEKEQKELLDRRIKNQQKANDSIAASREADLQEELAAVAVADDASFQLRIESLEKQKAIEIAAAEEAGLLTYEIEKKYTEQIAALKAAQAQSEINTRINTLKQLEAAEGSTLERRIQLIEEQANAQKLQITNSIKDEKERASAILLLETETQNAIREERKKTNQQTIDYAFEVADAVANTLGAIVELQGAQSQARIDEINNAATLEQEAINKSLESEADKQRKLDALRLRTSRQIAAEKTKQAKSERALNVFKAVIDTAASITKTGAQLGYPAAIPFQVAAGVIGATQIAAILAQPLPKFKKGGIVGGRSHDAGGTIIEAERGEFVVNRNAVTRHRSELDALNTSSAAFKRLIDERYVRPALNYYIGKKERAINVNASLNSKGMEKEIKGMRRDLKRNNTVININGNDSRYAWHLN
jgi:chromosome segregation ATPase